MGDTYLWITTFVLFCVLLQVRLIMRFVRRAAAERDPSDG